ncbi:MAG: UPF0262 family protein [Polyangiales bacterium]
MALTRIEIDELTWSTASKARRLDWSATMDALVDPDNLVADNTASSLKIELMPEQYRFQMYDSDHRLLHDLSVHYRDFEPYVDEYKDIVEHIYRAQQTGELHRVDTLDMAKKVAHDRAGRFLKRELRDMRFDLGTARRLFTLILALRFDTLRWGQIGPHRTLP